VKKEDIQLKSLAYHLMTPKQRELEYVKHRWAHFNTIKRLSRNMRRTYSVWKQCGGICHICGEKVPNPVNEWHLLNHSNYPSRDHVIPKSKGGKNLNNNIKLAHAKCNNKKGDTLDAGCSL